MLTKEDLQLLSDMIDRKLDERLKPIQQDISRIKDDTDTLKEQMEIIKYSTNELIRWVDTNFRHQYPFPVDRDVV